MRLNRFQRPKMPPEDEYESESQGISPCPILSLPPEVIQLNFLRRREKELTMKSIDSGTNLSNYRS